MFNDLTGKRFGRLAVIEMAPRTQKKTFWVCRCDCGESKIVRSDALMSGRTISCGCAKKEQDRINLILGHKHKMSGTRLYHIWNGMNDRCNNPNTRRYSRYGGRGIKVCREWSRESGFEPFRDWALAHGYDATFTIDRVDTNGAYGPANCRWSTQKEQASNRRTTVKITLNGHTKSLKQWCKEMGLNYGTIISRHQRGVSLDRLFSKEDLRTS